MKRFLLRGVLPLVALLSVAACSDDTTGPSLDSLVLEAGSLAIIIDDTTSLRAVSGKAGGRDTEPGKIQWKSLDQSIATVNGNGLVRGVSRGNARIVGTSGGARDTVTIHVIPQKFNVEADDACGPRDDRAIEIMAVGKHAIVIAEKNNPSGGFSPAEYQAIANSFDKQIHPIITKYFGEPADIDGNRRVLIFYTRKVNELTPAGSQGYFGGFFFGRDLFPKVATPRQLACAGSNEAEIFYMMVPDPNGAVNRNVRTKNFVQQVTLGTIAHEYQHLINASRRIFTNNAGQFETDWLNEGLSHMAEELMFYDLSGFNPQQNIDYNRLAASSNTAKAAFNSYQINNFARLDSYFENTAGESAYSNSTGLGQRGAIWHFLRYLADRVGKQETDLWFQLVNAPDSGLANIQRVIGQDPLPLYRDWTISTFTDDLVATSDPAFQASSWNHRSVLKGLLENPSFVEPRPLLPGIPHQVTLRGGGAAYMHFDVEALQRAEIRVTPAGTGTPVAGACTEETPPVVLGVGEVYTPAAGDGSTLCLGGAAIDAGYVVITTNLSRDALGSSAIQVTGFGITPPVALRSAIAPVLRRANHQSRNASFALSGAAGEFDGLVRDYSLDSRLRQLELNELAPLLGGGSGGARRFRAAPLMQAAAGEANDLYVSLVRIR